MGLTYQPLYLTADCSVWVVVDPIDWDWAHHFLWNYKPGTAWLGHKYAKRNVGAARTPVYLHREILLRADPVTPERDPRKRIADHIDGNTLDCRRANLRWVDHRTNALNSGGRSWCVPLVDHPSLDIPF